MAGRPYGRGPKRRRRRVVGDWFVAHAVEAEAGSDRAGSDKAERAPEASADVMTDPEGMWATGLEPSLNEREIDVVHTVAVEGPEDPQDVITGILEGVHHFTWHKNGISRTNRQDRVANSSHTCA